MLVFLAFARQPSVVEADPFLAFSTEDIEGMDKEVASILSHISTGIVNGRLIFITTQIFLVLFPS